MPIANLIHRAGRAGEEGGDAGAKRLCFRGIGSALGVDPVGGCLLGGF